MLPVMGGSVCVISHLYNPLSQADRWCLYVAHIIACGGRLRQELISTRVVVVTVEVVVMGQ